jgi:RNA polymerase sigma-70 factor (ECF subfamily)
MRNLAGALSPDLDDLVQLAAVQVFQSLPAFRGQCDILTWVYTICYRVLMQQRAWYRSWTKRFVLTDCEFDEQSSAQPLPTALLYARERTRRLHAGLSRMTDKYRAVVVLHDLEELDIAEVAVIVDANVLTVRSRLRDGRKQLQRILAADPEFERCGERHEIGV